jgi:hypothetical protein
MKLFHQLTPEQKDNGLHYCLNIILNDIFEHGTQLEPHNDEEKEVMGKVMAAVESVKDLPTIEDRIDALMADDEINSLLHDAAEEMAKGVYYMADNEMVIFEDEITDEDEEAVQSEKQQKKLLN